MQILTDGKTYLTVKKFDFHFLNSTAFYYKPTELRAFSAFSLCFQNVRTLSKTIFSEYKQGWHVHFIIILFIIHNNTNFIKLRGAKFVKDLMLSEGGMELMFWVYAVHYVAFAYYIHIVTTLHRNWFKLQYLNHVSL